MDSRDSSTAPAFSRDPRGLRVLWVTTIAAVDGPGRMLSALIGHWSDQDALAVCALRGFAPGFREAMPAGVRTFDLGMRGLWDVRALTRLVNVCRQWQPDVIQTQLSRADWIGRIAGALAGVPVVSAIHNLHSRMYPAEFRWPAASLGRLLDRLTGPLAARVVAVSSGVRDDLCRHGWTDDRVVVIHNGFDTDCCANIGSRAAVRRAWGCGPDDIVVGTVALLKPQKGIRHLVAAARLVAEARPHVRFVQMGDGPLRRDARRWVDAAGLADRFLLMGQVREPLALLPALDVFVLASLWEGLPVALFEAMATGLPCVGTRVSGTEEVIRHDRNGRLVPAGDPRALAAELIALIDDPALRARLGAAARDRLQHFDAPSISARYRALYAQVIGDGPASGGATPDAGVRRSVRRNPREDDLVRPVSVGPTHP